MESTHAFGILDSRSTTQSGRSKAKLSPQIGGEKRAHFYMVSSTTIMLFHPVPARRPDREIDSFLYSFSCHWCEVLLYYWSLDLSFYFALRLDRNPRRRAHGILLYYWSLDLWQIKDTQKVTAQVVSCAVWKLHSRSFSLLYSVVGWLLKRYRLGDVCVILQLTVDGANVSH